MNASMEIQDKIRQLVALADCVEGAVFDIPAPDGEDGRYAYNKAGDLATVLLAHAKALMTMVEAA